ncbi:CehA/McbA family metallohydrolase [Planctomycetota bacterium]
MAETKTISLAKHFNWPRRVPKGKEWASLVKNVREYPEGSQVSWGIPFRMGTGRGARVVMVSKDRPDVTVPVNGTATYLCFLHNWAQLKGDIHWSDPTEGLVVGEYEFAYEDGTSAALPVRARFEVKMAESPGPPWLAESFNIHKAVDPAEHHENIPWAWAQTGVTRNAVSPHICAMSNPHPDKRIKTLTIRGLQASPLLIAGLTLFTGKAHPLAHLPRRTYRVKASKKPTAIEKAEIDLGIVTRIEHTDGPRNAAWLKSGYAGTQSKEEDRGEDLIEAVGAEDATMSVKLKGRTKPVDFSLGEAFKKGRSRSGSAVLQVLGQTRQWMQFEIIDGSTGKPTPARVHFSGSHGEYLAPYGHHAQVNTNWFEDYGADVVSGGRSYAYVSGKFTSDMPVGDVYVEIFKGFEYEPVRRKVTIKPGQKNLKLKINRWKDLRSKGWVTADTHVHFISPHTAWLEGQAEGVNVVNLLASQWGRLFTNVGDIIGKPNVVEDDTIVYVGTENRNHMLGHMSMLGTKGDLPVYPMCCGGPGESWIGDPDFMLLAEWARENKRRRGVVIRPHYPFCGHTEDPVPILAGLVDALEINVMRQDGFPVQEWYRYLNCGYRVAVAGGTDKMSAGTALGWQRTYAKLDRNKPFTYDEWAKAMRAGRTVSTSGPVIDLTVDGKSIGDSLRMSSSGGTVEVAAVAECYRPIDRLEIVMQGQVMASAQGGPGGAKKLKLRKKIRVPHSTWIAARCYGRQGHPSEHMAAHTSPVYMKVGRTRAFDGPAAEHMLALVEGGIEYLNTLATVFDERSRKRMAKQFNEARQALKGRLIVEAGHSHHHGSGGYHTHGHGHEAGHAH